MMTDAVGGRPSDVGLSPEHVAALARTRPVSPPLDLDAVRAAMGRAVPELLPAPRDDSEAERWRWVHAYLAVAPLTVVENRRHGVPDPVTLDTLSDLGLKLATFGVDGGIRRWLSKHVLGTVHRLGRLQFERGDEAIDVHIPELGPLDPIECSASFTRARTFFPEHYPAAATLPVRCHSWLLDPALREVLPAGSNILRFAERFALTDDEEPGDADVARFVFGIAPDELATATPRSSLQRAVLDRLARGEHWTVRTGYLRDR